ncbi:MAG TPA: sigma-70 family RNA polymerase sigma factor, partial [Planctomycetaceae bacterium]|nr:sigma-70 family RNA polymerase sigma factor [Planctomycetaceae bacterium]
QELAVVVIRRPPVHVLPEKQPGWLYGLPVRTALMYRRKRGRQRNLQRRVCDQRRGFDGPPTDPLTWLLADERQQLVRQSLLRMTPKDRELLVLKYTEDWSYRELATRLNVSEAAVEARLHRARARLRSELSAWQLVESAQ